jgi:sodium-dependent dicarboxylate transporter 2/3/5
MWRPDLTSLAGMAGGEALDPRIIAVTAGMTVVMAVWWLTEAVPIPVTAMLPMVLLPLAAGGAFDLQRVAANYANWRVYLFFGGFLIAIAMESTGLHRRIALVTVGLIGTRPWRIVLGFMLASAFLSMWISNTATALMMLPIGKAVLSRFEGRRNFGEALMLGIAYGCSLGGVATPIGTPPNIAFQGIYGTLYPDGPAISFARWMAFALPIVIVMLPIAWYILVRHVRQAEGDAAAAMREETRRLGRPSIAERRVLVIFLLTAALWIFRQPFDVGWLRIPGWSEWTPWAAPNDGVVAMLMGGLLFLVSSGRGRGPLLRWDTVQDKMPWGILLLFGGGFALADAISGSGLSLWIGSRASFLAGLHPMLLVGGAAGGLTFLTEITSNTATAEVMLPLAAAVATMGVGINPLLLMLPVTLASSFAFMLPVATPPNAVIFGSGCVSMQTMMRRGFILNLVSIVVLTLVIWLLAPVLFGVDPGGGVPPWAAGK